MQVALLTPLACTALDTALDASGGGMAVLACGSGKKLKKALARSFTPSQFSPAKPALSRHQLLAPGWTSGRAQIQGPHFQAASHRHSSSLVTASNGKVSDPTRPFLAQTGAVPNPRSSEACSQGAATWVCDPGSLLAPASASSLEEALDRINASTGVQFAAVMLNDVQGSSDLVRFKDFGVKLFNAWGVGSAEHNNGVLLLLFKDARRLEVITGVGMSRVLPDSWLHEMQYSSMVPHFKEGRHAQALEVGVRAIEERLLKYAPHDWCKNQEKAIEDVSFRGGEAVKDGIWRSIQAQLSGDGEARKQQAARLLDLLKYGLYFGLLWGLSAGHGEDSQVQQLKERISQLEGKTKFVDAKGDSHRWPYAEAPGEMAGLLEPPNRPANHVFRLVRAGWLDMEAVAKGFGNQSLELTLRNKTDEPLELHLPAGSLFVPEENDRREQPLLLQRPIHVTLSPGEGRSLQLSTFCGDSGARVPRSANMVLSPYELSSEQMGGQHAVWRWSAKYQRGKTEEPCSQALDILLDSFGIRAEELHAMRSELDTSTSEGASQRTRKLSETQKALTERQKEVERMRREASRSSGGSYSSGGSGGFGGGFSSGGGAGCSW